MVVKGYGDDGEMNGFVIGVTRASLRSEKDRLNIDIYQGFIDFFWDHREVLVVWPPPPHLSGVVGHVASGLEIFHVINDFLFPLHVLVFLVIVSDNCSVRLAVKVHFQVPVRLIGTENQNREWSFS